MILHNYSRMHLVLTNTNVEQIESKNGLPGNPTRKKFHCSFTDYSAIKQPSRHMPEYTHKYVKYRTSLQNMNPPTEFTLTLIQFPHYTVHKATRSVYTNDLATNIIPEIRNKKYTNIYISVILYNLGIW